jgi:hypothetical protein
MDIFVISLTLCSEDVNFQTELRQGARQLEHRPFCPTEACFSPLDYNCNFIHCEP